jgi:predicted RecB family nuclease
MILMAIRPPTPGTGVPVITDDLFEAFIYCELKAHLRLTEASGDASEFLAWQQERLHQYQQSCRLRLRASVPSAEHLPDTSTADDLNSSDLPLFFNCHAETGQLKTTVDAVERLPASRQGDSSPLVPIRFVPNNHVTKHDRICLAYSAHVLSKATGTPCTLGKIIHGDGQATLRVKLTDHDDTVRAIIVRIAEQQTVADPPPLILNRHCLECEFRQGCRTVAVERDELTLLGGMSQTERMEQHSKGIFTVNQLAYTFRPQRRPKGGVVRPNKSDHALRALAIREARIYVTGKPEVNLTGTPVFLDVEGLSDRKFYYLIGLRYHCDDSYVQESFWADTPSEEAVIWAQFLKALEQIVHPVLIHYGSYETDFLSAMRLRYGVISSVALDIDHLARSAVNILSVMYGRIYFPTYSNSLKEIARYLGYHWSDEAASGQSAIVWRLQWDSSRDPGLREKLIQYNTEDCEALHKVTNTVVHLSNAPADDVERLTDVVDTTTLKREHPYRFAFGNKDFSLPEFEHINKAAYWDHQRERIRVKTGRASRKSNARMPKCPAVLLPVNKIVECSCPTCCPACSSTVFYKHGKCVKVIHDLKFAPGSVKRWIVRYHFRRFRCSTCLSTFYSPEKSWTGSKHGQNLLAYVVYQLVDLQLSHHTIAENLNQLFALHLDRQVVKRLKTRAAQMYLATYEAILKRIVSGVLVHADETKVSIRGKNGYVWVFTNHEEVVYVYSPTRESDVPLATLSTFRGVLVSDFYAAYDAVDCPQQKCLIHLMRDLNEDLLRRPFDRELKQVASDFAVLLKAIVDTVDSHGLKRQFLVAHKPAVCRFYEALEDRCYQSETAESYKTRFLKNRDRLFTFLNYDGVPWNNNNAEHAVKSFASLRRVVMGSSSSGGIREYLILLSIRETCRRKGVPFLRFLRSGEPDIELLVRGSRSISMI